MAGITKFYSNFVIAIDTRGHGQTPRGDAPFTIRQFAEDLLGFMAQHDQGLAHPPDRRPNSKIGTPNHPGQSLHREQRIRDV